MSASGIVLENVSFAYAGAQAPSVEGFGLSVAAGECVVLAGWMARLLTSATFASSEKMRSLSMNACASAAPPLISNVKMEPPPRGKYFSYSGRYPFSGKEGWFTRSTFGWFTRKSTTRSAFSTWRSTRRERVSSPCSSRKALKGEMAAPVSRSSTARI